MLTVALVGADGSGKSTVARALAERPGYVRFYCGANPSEATHGPETNPVVRKLRARVSPAHAGGPPTGQGRKKGRPVRRTLRLVLQITGEIHLELATRGAARRAQVVICDRHPLADQYAHDLKPGASAGWDRWIHRSFLRTFISEPNLLVVLDASATVMLARKGEGTLPQLESRRQEYLAYATSRPNAMVLDATSPVDRVVAEVFHAIEQALAGKPANA